MIPAILAGCLVVFLAAPRVAARHPDASPRFMKWVAFLAISGQSLAMLALLGLAAMPELVRARSFLAMLDHQGPELLDAHMPGRPHSLVAGLVLGVIILRFAWEGCRSLAITRRSRTGVEHHVDNTPGGYVVAQVPSQAWDAYSVGIWRPQVVVTDGLVEELEAEELAAVLFHEEGHIRQRHHVMLLLARAAVRALAPLSRPTKPTLDMLEQAIEECADVYAAKATSPQVVASAITRTALRRSKRPSVVLGVVGARVSSRVRRLLRGREPTLSAKLLGYACGVAMAVMVLVTQVMVAGALLGAAHHVAERTPF